MSNLKEIRSRISSVDSTKKITRAMKMVASAKLKKAQNQIIAVRPYAEKLSELVREFGSNLDTDIKSPYTQRRNEERVLLVPITSNRGLCGAFNTNVAKRVRKLIKEEYPNSQTQVLIIGKKGQELLSKEFKVLGFHAEIFDELSYSNSVKIIQPVLDDFKDEKFDKVVLLYNRFKNVATQILQVEHFLPILPPANVQKQTPHFIYEPSIKNVVQEILPKALKIQFYKSLRDSLAAEHAARMTAMHIATENATEILDQLKLTYNKARQAAITGEILEIVSGAEALKN
ncbi:MAG: ATP synthase F1 subunit gamma [Flavobacteriaceae bacterium]|nr:ATP synthase F1 subunit gamma [Flavobacteriaceae bacterium]